MLSDRSAGMVASTESPAATSLWLALADRLFGGAEPVPGPSHRWLRRYLGVAALLAAIIVARRPDAVTNPQFWAEDSTIYFWQHLTLGFWGSLGAFYNHYPMLVQRLVAELGGFVPLGAAPRVYTLCSIALTAVALAAFVLPGFRHLVRSDGLRALWCVAIACLPVDEEMLSNPTNLGWYLTIWLALLLVMRVPRRGWQVALLVCCAAVVVFTTPLAFVIAPVLLLRVLHALGRQNQRELGLVLGLAALLVAAWLVTLDLGRQGDEITLGGQTEHLLRNGWSVLWRWRGLVADRVAALVLSSDALAVTRGAGACPMIAMALAVVALGASAAGGFATLPALLLASYFAIVAVLISLLGRPQMLLLFFPQIPVRYTVFPAAMLVLALVAVLDGLPAGRLRRVVVVALVLVLGWAWRGSFVVPPFLDQDWPSWAARIEQKLVFGTPEPLVIPMNPAFNPLLVDVRAPMSASDVPPDEIVASLGDGASIRRSFVSTCDGLSQVDLYLGADAPVVRGDVTLTLLTTGPRAVASVTMPRAELGQGWQPFYFAPVAGSSGVRYTVKLGAAGNDPVPVSVYGKRGDRRADGEANTDVSIRYACTVPETALLRRVNGLDALEGPAWCTSSVGTLLR